MSCFIVPSMDLFNCAYVIPAQDYLEVTHDLKSLVSVKGSISGSDKIFIISISFKSPRMSKKTY